MLLSSFRLLAGFAVLLVVSSFGLTAHGDEKPAPAANEKSSGEIDFQQDIVYGTGGGEPLMLDLAMPKNLTKAVPGLIFIHGGGWQGGSRRSFDGRARDAAQKGYVAVSIGYRFAPKHRFPAQVEDCKCAVRWLRANAEKYHVDPNRIGVVGESAGAHLALMLGTMGKGDGLEGEGGQPEASSRVQAVVSFCGPTNLLAEVPTISKPILANFLGGPVQEKADSAKAASPITYVTADDPPTLFIQGTKDPLVPHGQAVEMAEALTKVGVPGRVELLIGEGHAWPKENERVMRVTHEFLAKYLNP